MGSIREIVTRGYITDVPSPEVIVGEISTGTLLASSMIIPAQCKNEFRTELDEDIDGVFLAEDEFTVQAVYTDVDANSYMIYGIFDDPFAMSQPDTEIGLQSIGPTFKCKLSDIEDISGEVRKGDKILICEREYSIQESQPDGVGLTTLILKYP